MAEREIHRTFKQHEKEMLPILLLFAFVFGWFGLQGLQGEKCPYAPWLTYIFYIPPLLFAAAFLGTAISPSATLSLFACPDYLRISSSWGKTNVSHEFARNKIRSISSVPTVSEGVPSCSNYYLVLNIWMDEPFQISNTLEKSDAMKLAQSLADMYEIPVEDHSEEVIYADFRSCDASPTLKSIFKKVRRK